MQISYGITVCNEDKELDQLLEILKKSKDNEDEIVVAIGGAPTGRAHARTGDRYQDMKEMGIEFKE